MKWAIFWAAFAWGYAVTALYLGVHGKVRHALWLTVAMLALVVCVLMLVGSPIRDGYSLPDGKIHRHDHEQPR